MRGSLPDLSRIVAAIQAAGPDLAEEVAGIIARQAPIGPGPTGGQFANSIHGESADTSNGVTLNVGTESDKPKLSWIVEGTAAHLIPAAHLTADGRPGFLRFELQGGDIVFTRGPVHHPGTSANPFTDRAISDVTALLSARLPQIIAEAVGEGA